MTVRTGRIAGPTRHLTPSFPGRFLAFCTPTITGRDNAEEKL